MSPSWVRLASIDVYKRQKEIDTSLFMNETIAAGKTLILPRCAAEHAIDPVSYTHLSAQQSAMGPVKRLGFGLPRSTES